MAAPKGLIMRLLIEHGWGLLINGRLLKGRGLVVDSWWGPDRRLMLLINGSLERGLRLLVS
jgi:hypothetical protein